MANSWQKHKSNTSQTETGVRRGGADEKLPELSPWLTGIKSDDGKSMLLQPHTLTLWLEGGRLHFCLQYTNCPDKVFGSCDELAMGLEGVDEALANEHFSSRKSKPR